jgi:hypothetical protein
VTNSARLKFIVHAYGICLKPEVKKPIRKPLTMLQPLKKEKSTSFAPHPPPASSKNNPNETRIISKGDQTTIIADHSRGSSYKSACRDRFTINDYFQTTKTVH